MRIYTIYDKVAKEAGPVFDAKNDDVAARSFRNLIAQNHVTDSSEYQLFCLGEYDNEKPSIEGFLIPDVVNTKLEDDDE